MYCAQNERSVATRSRIILPTQTVSKEKTDFFSFGLIFLFFIFNFHGISFAASLDLTKDSNGWTVFRPSSDSLIVYVSSSSGNDATCTGYSSGNDLIGSDPFNPVGAVVPCATYAAAYSKTRSNMPDWILLKRGDTWTERIYGSVRNGRSTTEPFLISAYGSSGNLPVIKIASSYDTQMYFNGSRQYIAISSVDFYASVRDPESADYSTSANIVALNLIAGTGNISQGYLFEGCKFRFFKELILTNMKGLGDVNGITFRRNQIFNNYSGTTAHSQGIFASYIRNLTFEENLFDHNGWLLQNDSDGIEEMGEATMFNHSIYISFCDNVTIKNNIIMRSSSSAVKLDNDGLPAMDNISVTGNLILDNEIGIGVNDGDTDEDYRGHDITIEDNVLSHLGRSSPTNRRVAWGIVARDMDIAFIKKNLMINQNLPSIDNVEFFELWGGCRSVVFSDNIAYNNKNSVGLYLRAGGPKDVQITNNKIQNGDSSGYTIKAGDSSPKDIDTALSGYRITNNKYYSSRPLNSRVTLNNVNISDSAWFSNTGDTSTFEQVSFPDSTRSVETYMKHIGLVNTIDEFITKCRAQDRYNWNKGFTAEIVNGWIREGFFINKPADFGITR